MIIFNGPPAQHVIQLFKVDAHYHGCTSYGGFMSKSYFCHYCNGRVTKMTMNTIPVKAANANRAKEKIVLTS